jgi:cell division septum initiation protein DivIVA
MAIAVAVPYPHLMPMRPEELSLAGLPRTPLGGVRADATDELLRRAAWDYREVLAENERLAQTVEELSRRVEELEAKVSSPERTSPAVKDPDELARALLASVRQAVREQREAARAESELILRKARHRALDIERDGHRRASAARRELATLEQLSDALSVTLRKAVESVLTSYSEEPNALPGAEKPADAEPQAEKPVAASNGDAATMGGRLALPPLDAPTYRG